MVTIVIGGSGSGKSDYAESLLDNYTKNKYYIATMQVYDDEMHKKVERHRRRRAQKGFETIEQQRDIIKAAQKFSTPRGCDVKCVALLECMSNLVANEMFSQESKMGIMPADMISSKIIWEMKELSMKVDEFVIVTNNISEDGIAYDQETMEYIKAISDINIELSNIADKVVEVVAGIPIVIKDVKEVEVCQQLNQ